MQGRKKVPPPEHAERVLEGSSQPVSTESSRLDLDDNNPEDGTLEKTMKDYYSKSDVEEQGGVPSAPPDSDPMPHQDLRKPKNPRAHNM